MALGRIRRTRSVAVEMEWLDRVSIDVGNSVGRRPSVFPKTRDDNAQVNSIQYRPRIYYIVDCKSYASVWERDFVAVVVCAVVAGIASQGRWALGS